MLAEITLREVIKVGDDDSKKDDPQVRLGFHADVDTVTVNMYRRTLVPAAEGEALETVTFRALVDTVTQEGQRDSTLVASVTVDKGDLADTVAALTGSSERIRTRAEVEQKVKEERNKNLPLTLAETTGKEANKRFEKLYAEFEKTAADLRNTQAELSAAKQLVEMLKEEARAEGRSPDIEVTEIDLTKEEIEEVWEEEVVPVGAPGDAEDETS